MNAIELLETQHRDVDELFARLQRGDGDGDERRRMFDDLADLLAIHASIEELHFYPAVKQAARAQRTEQILEHSLEEHLGIKRKLAVCMASPLDSRIFEQQLRALAEEVQHHVKDERDELFPKVRRIFDGDQLEAIGQEMVSSVAQLQQGRPRFDVPLQTIAPMPLINPVLAQTRIGSAILPHVERLFALPLQLVGVAKKARGLASGFMRGLRRGMARKRPA